jgi:hypothetical protein
MLSEALDPDDQQQDNLAERQPWIKLLTTHSSFTFEAATIAS